MMRMMMLMMEMLYPFREESWSFTKKFKHQALYGNTGRAF